MARITPVSKAWISLTRPLGTIFPGADVTISMWPKLAQIKPKQNSVAIDPLIARPVGEGSISTILRAAGRKSISCFSRRSRVKGKEMTFFATEIAALADFMDVALQTVEHSVSS